MGPMKDPDLARVRHQQPKLILGRLHVLVVQQHMRAGYRCACRRHPRNHSRRRVLQRIARQLVLDRLRDVDLAVVRHLEQVQQHVCDLFADALLRSSILVRKLRRLRRHPLKDLRELSRLDQQGRRQILRRVKRLPIAFRSKVAQLGL